MQKQMASNEKTTTKEKMIYGSASIADSVCYGFVGTFGMFFLTTVAGIDPAPAGTIVAIGTIWNAVFTPIIGNISDRYHQKHGNRGGLIMRFGVPLMIFTFLLFFNIGFHGIARIIYCGVMMVCFWSCFTGFFIPYYALGVDYTSDYEDRTRLRLVASLFNSLGSFVSVVLPTTIIKLMENAGVTTGGAWGCYAAIIGVLSLLSIIITVYGGRSKDVPPLNHHELEQFNLMDVFREYVELARVKPMQYLLVLSFAALMGQTIFASNLMYYFSFFLGLSPEGISLAQLFKTFFSIAMLPFVGMLAARCDKRQTLFILWGIGCGMLVAIRFVPMPLVLLLALVIFAMGLCMGTYWQLVPSIFYDVCEYDRIVLKEDRSSAIVSFQGFVEAFAQGVGSQLLGIILHFAGFNGEAATQTATALTWVDNCMTLVPIVFFLIAFAALLKYPITRKYYNEMLARAGRTEE